ncbi:MAG TPA: flagellar export chaperone FliS [Gammaproteobacteria bacterium]|nr:flagellar export chaperone FliS [Gammaproteobacteria bacterium]
MSFGRPGIAQYQQVGTQSASYADPWELTGMLFSGAIERIAQARHALETGDVARRGERISKAISILDELRGTLDHDMDPDFAGNLDALYDYMQTRLLHANAQRDAGALDEVAGLLREIKAGWDGIPTEARSAHAQRSAEPAGR